MVFNYKRKTQRAEQTLKEAINEAKRTNIKQAAKKYGISYSVLQRRVKTGSYIMSLGRFKHIFTDDKELELVQHLKDLDALFYGLTKTEFLHLAGEYAESKNLQTTFKENVAGKQWFKNFKKRHPEIVLRTPAAGRQLPFNGYAIGEDYFAPSAVYNSELLIEEHDWADYCDPVKVTQYIPTEIFAQEIEAPASAQSELIHMETAIPNISSKTVHQLSENGQVIKPMDVIAGPSNVFTGIIVSEVNMLDEKNHGTTTPPPIRSQNMNNLLYEIHPLPQKTDKKTNRRRQPQKSEILTSTPIKTLQKDKFDKSQQKKVNILKTSISGQKKVKDPKLSSSRQEKRKKENR